MFTSYTERFPHCVEQTELKCLCVCMYGGGDLAEKMPAVASHSRGLEANDGTPGKSLRHRVCFFFGFVLALVCTKKEKKKDRDQLLESRRE